MWISSLRTIIDEDGVLRVGVVSCGMEKMGDAKIRGFLVLCLSMVERFIVYLCSWSSGFEVFILNFVILKCWVGVSLLSFPQN